MKREQKNTGITASQPRRNKWLIGTGLALFILLALGVFGYFKIRRTYLNPEMMRDIKAGLAAKDIKNPDQRFTTFLEQRYGPQTEAANREKAFLDFFNPEHIRNLQTIVAHSPEGQRPANIAATARWVAQFRANLSPADRASLAAKLKSDSGHQMLREAMAQYNSQDIYYRGATTPVIAELLKTIHEVQGRR